MNTTERELVLSCERLPARLDPGQVSALLGFMQHEITLLMKLKLLKPLGDPAPNGHKFFSSAEILALTQDRQWLDRATKAVSRQWQRKNQLRKAVASQV